MIVLGHMDEIKGRQWKLRGKETDEEDERERECQEPKRKNEKRQENKNSAMVSKTTQTQEWVGE